MKKTLKKAGIWAVIGFVFAVAVVLIYALCENDTSSIIENLIFWPVYFVGLGFCKWSLIGRIFLGIWGAQLINRRDRYHIGTTFAGSMVFSYIIVLGWIVGLIKFVVILSKGIYVDWREKNIADSRNLKRRTRSCQRNSCY